MTNKQLDYQTWLKNYAKHIENSDSYVYNGSIYKENELVQHYNNLKVTEVVIRAYDMDLMIYLHDDKHLGIDEVYAYVHKNITDTALVKSLKHC